MHLVLRTGILILCFLGSIDKTDAFLSRSGAVVAPNTKQQGKRGKDNAKKNDKTVKIRPDKKKDTKTVAKEKGGSRKPKVDPKAVGRGNKNAAAGNNKSSMTAVVEATTTWLSKQFQSLSAFVMSRPAQGEAPYLLVGVRYLIVAMFFCLAGIAIIDSFSQVPSLFGEATIVVTRPR
ncbi:hypothetical protein MHU86_1718 [Fragilaria crotonensis]|nr:hypothetical protein MHU86_1718 [Fragilaria crotonensis]